MRGPSLSVSLFTWSFDPCAVCCRAEKLHSWKVPVRAGLVVFTQFGSFLSSCRPPLEDRSPGEHRSFRSFAAPLPAQLSKDLSTFLTSPGFFLLIQRRTPGPFPTVFAWTFVCLSSASSLVTGSGLATGVASTWITLGVTIGAFLFMHLGTRTRARTCLPLHLTSRSFSWTERDGQ